MGSVVNFMSKHSDVSAIFDNALRSRARSPDVILSMIKPSRVPKFRQRHFLKFPNEYLPTGVKSQTATIFHKREIFLGSFVLWVIAYIKTGQARVKISLQRSVFSFAPFKIQPRNKFGDKGNNETLPKNGLDISLERAKKNFQNLVTVCRQDRDTTYIYKYGKDGNAF